MPLEAELSSRLVPKMDVWIRLLSFGMLAWMGFNAWKRKDRRGVIDAVLLVVAGAALQIPEPYVVLRYGIAGTALAIVLVRSVKRDLIDGSDTYARWMTIGVLVFIASIVPALLVSPPPPVWMKYLAIGGGVVMMATMLRPFLWMTRLLFSAYRLVWDLKRSRPPREADEKALGIDLSPLREPRGPESAR